MTGIHQKVFEFELLPAVGGQDFLVAPSNQEAVNWLNRWPDWQVPAIVIYGPPGCGKSHLANLFLAKSGAILVTPALLRRTGVSRILENVLSCVVEDVFKCGLKSICVEALRLDI